MGIGILNQFRQRIAMVLAITTMIMAASWARAATGARSPQPAKGKNLKEFMKWPAGSSPQEIGKRVAERYAASDYLNLRRTPPTPHIIYPEVCTWYGALTFADLSGDRELTERLVRRFEPLLGTKASLVPPVNHVDNAVFGVVPLEIYMETRQPRYLKLGQSIAEQQWENPRPDGLTSETRFWIDDMYMVTALQVQAYRATAEPKYLDRAALEMTAYLDKLQQPNGLFYHAPDVPFFWGRGNGWVAAGMAELLRSLPKKHPQRPRILRGYRLMMQVLVRYQNQDGMWRQLIDHAEAWPETSSTGMFAFAMITGVKNGWLERKVYGGAARKAWLALVSYLEHNGDIRNVCEGTNKKNDLEYYLNRARLTGDLHGEAPILWAASALLR